MERQTKTRHCDEHEHSRAFHPKAYATGDPRESFFLAINHRRRPEDKVRFLNVPMDKNKIGRFLSSATENVQITSK